MALSSIQQYLKIDDKNLAGDQTILVAGGTSVQYVMTGYVISCDKDVTITWKSAAGTTVSGPIPLLASTPLVAQGVYIDFGANGAIIINTAGTGTLYLGGHLLFTLSVDVT